jgi:hypothetical protein
MIRRSTQLTLDIETKIDIASYAVDLVRGSLINAPEVSRRLKRTAGFVIGSLVLTGAALGLIRFGPNLGEAAPFVTLILIAFAALFVYSLVAFTVLAVTALTIQHVRIVEAQSDMCGVLGDLQLMRDVLADLYDRDPQSVEAVAKRHSVRGAQETLRELGIAK